VGGIDPFITPSVIEWHFARNCRSRRMVWKSPGVPVALFAPAAAAGEAKLSCAASCGEYGAGSGMSFASSLSRVMSQRRVRSPASTWSSSPVAIPVTINAWDSLALS
jgi:hypothetical protein